MDNVAATPDVDDALELPARVGPLLLYGVGSIPLETLTQRTDVVLVEISIDEHDPELLRVALPQLGLQLCNEDPEALMHELIQRILSFYAGVKDLPDAYIDEVKEEQINLVERLILPWLGQVYGANPSYIAPPPTGSTRLTPITDDRLVEA